MAEDDKIFVAIQQFMAIADLKDEEAVLNYLQMTNFQVEEALNIFWMQQNQNSNNDRLSRDSYEDYGIKRFREDNILDEEGRRIIPDDVKRQRLIEYPDPITMMQMHNQRGFIQGISYLNFLMMIIYLINIYFSTTTTQSFGL